MPEVLPKIAALIPYQIFPPKMGGQKGIALFYLHLSREMPLTILGPKNIEAESNEHIKYIPVYGNDKWRYVNPFLFLFINSYIKKNKITHLIIEHTYYGWLIFLLRLVRNTKIIIHSHNIDSMRFKSIGKWWWWILWHYEKQTHKKADLSFFIHDEDREFAIEHFKLEAKRCSTITYGIEIRSAPLSFEKKTCRTMICKKYNINANEKILLFNGSLNYKPNQVALNIILEQINPLLLGNKDFKYKIIICGSKLPEKYEALNNYKEKNIIYAGFVDDISQYFMGTDVFINPVTDGGGIKTKVVEALGYDLSVVSTQTGALGIPTSIAGDKLKVVVDFDWKEFSHQIFAIDAVVPVQDIYFQHFYWGNIVKKAAKAIKRC